MIYGKQIKSTILVLLFIPALWDTATTLIGTYEILNYNGIVPSIASFVISIFVLAMLFLTIWIWDNANIINDIFLVIFKVFWSLALIYDLLTSWNGNVNIVFSGHPEGLDYLIIIALTIFMSFSPIALSYIYKYYD